MPHLTTGKDGIERLVHDRHIWVCLKCLSFVGYTYAQKGITRIAFCKICDEHTNQTSSTI